jgi:hypothetical protein
MPQRPAVLYAVGKYAGTPILVDRKHLQKLSRFRWYIHTQSRGGRRYAYRREGRRTVYLHREILATPPASRLQCDHVNHDGLDCRESNLRNVTVSQNHFNRRKSKGRSSRFKGVYFNAKAGKWVASIEHEGRHRYVGRFAVEADAARAFDAAALALRGEYAAGTLNFPPKRSWTRRRPGGKGEGAPWGKGLLLWGRSLWKDLAAGTWRQSQRRARRSGTKLHPQALD